MSRLLLASGTTENVASSLLQEAAPNLKGKFTELVQVDPINTACEILKTAAEHDQKARSKVTTPSNILAAANFYRYMKHSLSSLKLLNRMCLSPNLVDPQRLLSRNISLESWHTSPILWTTPRKDNHCPKSEEPLLRSSNSSCPQKSLLNLHYLRLEYT
jgi:hypothetical protein